MLSIVAVAAVHIAITAATLQGLPHRTLSATDDHGHTAQYGGVALSDVLAQAGIPAGEALRGKVMTRYVIVDAADGYRVVFSLAELDAAYTDRVVLIADTMDGAVLSPKQGPFRLVVPGEKRDARWIGKSQLSTWRMHPNYEDQRTQSTIRKDRVGDARRSDGGGDGRRRCG